MKVRSALVAGMLLVSFFNAQAGFKQSRCAQVLQSFCVAFGLGVGSFSSGCSLLPFSSDEPASSSQSELTEAKALSRIDREEKHLEESLSRFTAPGRIVPAPANDAFRAHIYELLEAADFFSNEVGRLPRARQNAIRGYDLVLSRLENRPTIVGHCTEHTLSNCSGKDDIPLVIDPFEEKQIREKIQQRKNSLNGINSAQEGHGLFGQNAANIRVEFSYKYKLRFDDELSRLRMLAANFETELPGVQPETNKPYAEIWKERVENKLLGIDPVYGAILSKEVIFDEDKENIMEVTVVVRAHAHVADRNALRTLLLPASQTYKTNENDQLMIVFNFVEPPRPLHRPTGD